MLVEIRCKITYGTHRIIENNTTRIYNSHLATPIFVSHAIRSQRLQIVFSFLNYILTPLRVLKPLSSSHVAEYKASEI